MSKNKLKKNGLKGMAAAALMSMAVPAFAADTNYESADMATVAEMQVEHIDLEGFELSLFGETFFPIETEEGLVFPSVRSNIGNYYYIDYKDEAGNIKYRRPFHFTEEVNQYDIEVGGHYAFVEPFSPWGNNKNDDVQDGVVIDVYEEPGVLFGTNRMCDYINQQTGELVTIGVGKWSWDSRQCYKVEFGELEKC